MSNYTALYRAWRPKRFEEVVGQPDIIEALKNQIKNGSIAHAYLFSGTRGTGKTSTAKIFSRAINCLAPVEANPCNACDICKGILDESLMDVVEIDAASNNGVDDIRELRENVKYPPSRSKYKVYIIDEVHMLSTGAFNALLKTLEEPPSYVIFILATTEPHKLPATILSRCQRYDFKRVGSSDLKHRLAHICEAQGVTFEEAALELIIRKSDGAVRDSLSMLDQCLGALGEGALTEELAIRCLGVVDTELIAEIMEACYHSEVLKLFEVVDQLIADGKNLNQFVKDSIDYLRDLMMVASAGPIEKILKTSADLSRLEQQAKQAGLNRIMRDLALMVELDHQMKWSANTRVQLEMALVKMTQAQNSPITVAAVTATAVTPAALTKKAVVPEGPKPEKTAETVKGTPTPAASQTAEAMPVTGDADPKVVEAKWPEVIQYLAKNKKASVRALLVEGVFVGAMGKTVQVGYEALYGFHLNAIQKDENRLEVEKAIYAVTGYNVRVQFDFLDAFMATGTQTKPSDDVDALKEALGEHADKLEILE